MFDELEPSGLSSFLADWHHELALRGQHDTREESAPGGRGHGDKSCEQAAAAPPASARPEGNGGRLLGKRARAVREESDVLAGEKKSDSMRREERLRDPPPMFVLPPGRGRPVHGEVEVGEGEGEGGGSATEQRRGGLGAEGTSLVDMLIADLDEINVIPFFDVQLPRELALIIFSHLDMRDLCACAQVSRSWCSLARDNILWCNVCHHMGFETSLDVYGHICWITVVREIVLRKKKVVKNWKERICGLSDHQPERVGVLCCVDFCPPQAIACYSSGDVFSWDLDCEDGPSRVQQGGEGGVASTAPAQPLCCSLCQGWAAVGYEGGSFKVIDTDTCSEVFCQRYLGTVNSICVRQVHGCTAVAASSFQSFVPPGHFRESIVSDVRLLVASEGGGGGEGSRGGWEQHCLQLPRDQVTFKVTRAVLVPTQSAASPAPFSLLYSTATTLTLHPPHLPHSQATHILTSAGDKGVNVINCFDVSSSLVACGTSAYGYRVQLFDLPLGAYRRSLHGHTDQVMCINLASSPPDRLITGSADKRVRVFDIRSSSPSLSLRGHSSPVLTVQMDEQRVISGSLDGTLIVWDLRMKGELWRSHERHPLELCRFHGNYLLAAHVPVSRPPVVGGGSPLLCHRRHRGLLRLFDFSVDPLSYTKLLPSICSSGYDEPSASFYNLDLRVPYDDIT